MHNTKKPRLAAVSRAGRQDILGEGRWKDWPAPAEDLKAARTFMKQWWAHMHILGVNMLKRIQRRT